MPENPDTAEKTIRFLCGSLFGLLIGAYIGVRWEFTHNQGYVVAVVISVSVGLLFGVLATKYGDRFWRSGWWK